MNTHHTTKLNPLKLNPLKFNPLKFNPFNRQVLNRQAQTGATFFGMLIVVAAIIVFGITGMKIFPAYSEFYTVKSLLQAMNKEPLSTMSKKEIMDAFDRRATVSYVTSISGKDLIIEKNAGETVVSVSYQVVKPLFFNISVLVDFAGASNQK